MVKAAAVVVGVSQVVFMTRIFVSFTICLYVKNLYNQVLFRFPDF